MKSASTPLLLLQLCLCFVYTVGRQNTDVCVLIRDCPSARNYNASEIESRICGYENNKRYARIWCEVKCVTPDSEKGLCRPPQECESFDLIYRNSDPNSTETREYLRKFVCTSISSIRKHYVCCSNKPLRPQSTTPTAVVPPNDNRTSVFDNQQCGIASEQYKVVGGTVADIGDHPWLALLQYSSKGVMSFLCGGTLISNRYVITAAHCVNNRFGKLVNVVLGDHNTTSPLDCIGNSCAPPPKTIKIESPLIHPGWDNADRQFYDDIALLRLAQVVEFSETIQPICLPPPKYKPTHKTKMTVAGWGRTDDRAASDVKRVATLYLQDRSVCWNTIKIPLVDRQLCVGGGKADSCKGDSGGPLMASNEDKYGISTWHLVGVVSLGYDSPCGTTDRPGIYTHVSHYLNWIRENTY